MNPEDPSTDSPALSDLLRAAQGGPELPAGFNAGVWRGIRQGAPGTESDTATGWAGWLAQLLLQPRWAVAVLLGMAILGAVTGAVSATASARLEARDRYVASIDPLQAHP